MQWYGVNGIRRRSERESRGGGYCVWMNVIRQKANLSERLVKGRGTCTTPRDWWKLAASFWFFSENNKSMCIQFIHPYFFPSNSTLWRYPHTTATQTALTLSLSLIYFLYYFIYSTCKLQPWPINKFLYLWWIFSLVLSSSLLLMFFV